MHGCIALFRDDFCYILVGKSPPEYMVDLEPELDLELNSQTPWLPSKFSSWVSCKMGTKTSTIPTVTWRYCEKHVQKCMKVLCPLQSHHLVAFKNVDARPSSSDPRQKSCVEKSKHWYFQTALKEKLKHSHPVQAFVNLHTVTSPK